MNNEKDIDLESLYEYGKFSVKEKNERRGRNPATGEDLMLNACVSLMKMSPLTAVLKCPHYEKGHYSNESEREAEVPSPADGYGW